MLEDTPGAWWVLTFNLLKTINFRFFTLVMVELGHQHTELYLKSKVNIISINQITVITSYYLLLLIIIFLVNVTF